MGYEGVSGMATIYNDPAEFTDEATDGFVDLYSDRLRKVVGGVVRRDRPARPKVAVIVGGGSGHYPAFCGVVGPGFADAAVIGNIFTSPSTAQAYNVGRAINSGAGVIYTYGNYAGDVMNFGLAGERLQGEGIEARQMIVTDDIASAPRAEAHLRRGIAGDFVVFKVLGAAAEQGLDIDEVMRLGELANAKTFTLGLAFSGCTFPGATEPHFTVPDGKMGLGLGIHGEPGLEDVDWVPASELAKILVSRILEERPEGSSGRVAAILNGLGATKYEELFLLWGFVAAELRDSGLTIVGPEVGELVTSLDMGGVSLTLCWLDDELEPLWMAPCDTPAFKRGGMQFDPTEVGEDAEWDGAAGAAAANAVGSEDSMGVAAVVVDGLKAMQSTLHEAEEDLGRMDAIAGDGDHGRGMVRGIDYAVEAAVAAQDAGWGAAGVLDAAGDAWAEYAGGTSGVLWGAALRAFGQKLGNEQAADGAAVATAVEAFVDAISGLGKAQLGDKTMLDAALPFADSLRAAVDGEKDLAQAWLEAAAAARHAADASAELSPKKGRARPLAARSIGHPDPGAISFAMCMRAIGEVLAG